MKTFTCSLACTSSAVTTPSLSNRQLTKRSPALAAQLIACISRRLPPPDAPAGEGRLNDIHVAAAFTKLVAFCGDALPLDVVPAIAPLVRHALGLVERRRLGGRELASLIYASAKLNLDASGALECGGGGSGGAVTKEAWWAALWAASEATMASANLQGARRDPQPRARVASRFHLNFATPAVSLTRPRLCPPQT